MDHAYVDFELQINFDKLQAGRHFTADRGGYNMLTYALAILLHI